MAIYGYSCRDKENFVKDGNPEKYAELVAVGAEYAYRFRILFESVGMRISARI